MDLPVVPGCPKRMKNGPCGGVEDSRCEVYRDRKCIFVASWEALKKAGRIDKLSEVVG